MKKLSIPALALTGAMILSLAACSSKGPEATPTPAPAETPNGVESVKPSEAPAAPSESTQVIAPPAETDAVVKPLESQKPAESQPAETPSEAPSAAPTAAEVYAQVSAVAGGNPMIDAGFVLEEFYNLSADDLEDFVFYMPEMSATTEEIFIARVKSGKMDAVKGACESRQQGMKEDGTMYPSAAVYVENSQIVTNGDWIMFAVAADSDAAVNAFNTCTK